MTAAPCIGTIGRIAEDSPNDRSKGTLTEVQMDRTQLRDTLERVAREHTFGTRLSVRLFLAPGVNPYHLGEIPWHDDVIHAEADIPVVGHPQIGRFVYFGACTQARRQPRAVFGQELCLYEDVTCKPSLATAQGITLEILRPHIGLASIVRLLKIYRSRYDAYLTAFTADWLLEMVRRNRVAVARDAHGVIMSVCIAELAQFNFDGAPPIRFAELTDAATAKEAEGRGYYSTLKRWLIETLRQEESFRVITTEARANSKRVLRSNVGIGLKKAGYQPSHCVIRSNSDEAVEQVGRYGDLVVFYVP